MSCLQTQQCLSINQNKSNKSNIIYLQLQYVLFFYFLLFYGLTHISNSYILLTIEITQEHLKQK